MIAGDSRVSIYQNIFDTTGHYTVSVDDALERIKIGKSKDKIIAIRAESNSGRQQNLKQYLPSITFSGVFSERLDDKLTKHSGFMRLDFDIVDDVKKEWFKNWEYSYAVWDSPRNFISVLIRIANGKKHRQHFSSLLKMFPDTDVKCANQSRVTYESYDPNIYINKNSKVWTEYIDVEVVSKVDTTNDKFEIYKKLLRWMDKSKGAFASGNRNFYVYILAGAMCRYGLFIDDTISILVSEYANPSDDFDKAEIEKSIRSAYKKNTSSAGSCEFSNEKLSHKETKHEVNPQIFEDGFKPDDIIYGSDVYEKAVEIYLHGRKSAETTHIKKLDAHFKFRRGELTALTGIGNYGKSSYMNQLMLIKSLFNGDKWAVFSPENCPAEEYYLDMAEALVGCSCDAGNWNKPSRKAFDDAYKFVSDHFFYVYPESFSPTPEYVKAKFMEMILKEKVSGVVIDPFNQLSNEYGSRSDKYLETILSDFLRFAQVNNVFFIVIAHPHKLQLNGAKDYPCPTIFQIADGGMWNNKCTNILAYHRPYGQSDPSSPACEHHSLKIRFEKIIGIKGKFDFEFNRKRRRFYFDGTSPLDGNRFEAQSEMKITPNLNVDNAKEDNKDYSIPF